MVRVDITALAALAGSALVSAAVTDAWEDTRRRIARLFGRGTPDAAIEQRLDRTRAQLAAASPAELDKVSADQAARWSGRLADLLEDYPEVEANSRLWWRNSRNGHPAAGT